jgi:competence protein ComEA
MTISSMPQWPNAVQAGGKEQININKASVEELVQLPRVGAKVAERIIEYRKQHGAFKTVDDLKTVRGIGDKMLEQIRPMVCVK